MRDTRNTSMLVARADFVPDLCGHDGGAPVGLYNNLQAIIEHLFLDICARDGHLRKKHHERENK